MQATTEESIRSAAATARRSQIIAATIDVIAREGFPRASFARIADHAGLSSTRLISYHFAGKDELIAAVTTDILSTMGAHMWRRVGAETTATGRLRAYIQGTVEFTGSHRRQMKALTDIFLAGEMHYVTADDQRVIGHVEAILRHGQAAGEFRNFDPVVMAIAIQRAIEGLPFQLAARPDLDVAAYGRELMTLFDLGTRRERR